MVEQPSKPKPEIQCASVDSAASEHREPNDTDPRGKNSNADACGCHSPHADDGDHPEAAGCGSDPGKGAGCGCAQRPDDACDGKGCGCGDTHEHAGSGAGGCEGCDGECSGCDGEDAIDPAWLDEHAPAVDTPAPEEIAELVFACLHFVKDAFGIELDFTPETLPVLDHYLTAARETLNERSELRELVWRFSGAYFGELVRRRFNGFWDLPSADIFTWRINFRNVLLSFNPVGMAAEAIACSEHGPGPTGALRVARPEQTGLVRRLEEMPPLPEDQFFLLSTRLEVIDAVVEHLRVRLQENDQAEFEFDPDDYANDLQPYGSA